MRQTDLTARIEERLRSYCSQAQSRQRGSRAARALEVGALASIVPMVAATQSMAQVQCHTIVPTGTIVLSDVSATGPNPSSVQLTASAVSLGKVFFGSSSLMFSKNFAAGVYSTGTYYPYGGERRNASESFSTLGAYTSSFVNLCELSSTGAVRRGLFCPPSGRGFLPVIQNAAAGFIELEILSMSPSQVSFRVGQFQRDTGSSGHAGDCSSISLPVELVSFEAVVDDGAPVLSWETASELNNAGFEIQRASGQGAYRKVAFVDGNGTANVPNRYNFRDEAATPNTAYRYRLKQIDFDGSTSFSSVVEVFTEVPGLSSVSEVYPNPVNGRGAKVNINVADPTTARIEVYDVRGALVAADVQALSRGANGVRLKSEGLAKGSHFAKVQLGEVVVYRPFVVLE